MCPNKTKFNPNWLTRAAKNEDPISLYIQAIFEDRHRVKCTWCSSDFEIGSRGFLSIKTHSEQKNKRNMSLQPISDKVGITKKVFSLGMTKTMIYLPGKLTRPARGMMIHARRG